MLPGQGKGVNASGSVGRGEGDGFQMPSSPNTVACECWRDL